MKTNAKFVTAALVAALAFGSVGSAFAASTKGSGYESSFNTIKSISGMTVTLADGTSYELPYGFDVGSLHVGERIAVTWVQQGDNRNATSVIAD